LKLEPSTYGERVRKMFQKTFSLAMIALLFLSMIMLAFNVQQAKADAQTVYINPDGSITPAGAPIMTSDKITYTFTGDMSYPTYYGIFVQRSNIVIDGNGYTVQGNQSGMGIGVGVVPIDNVTIKNVRIEGFLVGIEIDGMNDTIKGNDIVGGAFGIVMDSSGTTVSENNVTGNSDGICLQSYSNNNIISGNNATENGDNGIIISVSSNNMISDNRVIDCDYGINLVVYSDNNTVTGNSATGNGLGIHIGSSNNNTVTGNNLTENSLYGIELEVSSWNTVTANNVINNSIGLQLLNSSNNTIYHNSFTRNLAQISIHSASIDNTWNDTYPLGGNYWSDYNGTDFFNGPYQNVTGSDGIGDTPYVIDANNTDNYPLMNPFSIGPLSVTISPATATLVIGQSHLFTSTVSGGTLTYTYQWYLNGAAVPGANSNRWTFTPKSVGAYTVNVEVTDSVGTQAMSNTALVQVIFLEGPFFTLFGVEYWIVQFPGEHPTRLVSND
jgi:parallel beta-helix repeat protein